MSKLIHRIEKYIQKSALFSKENTLLLAVSGGVDSMVLADVLHGLGYNIAFAHCNFQLRGEASDSDEKLVKLTAKQMGIISHSTSFETEQYANENNISIQLAARNLRYEWFNQLISTNEYSHLLTAHHANDQIETVLYNLVKGTGIAGLRGIPKQRGNIVRPLLAISRHDIEEYATNRGIKWNEDVSNQMDKYARNKIRLNVIPKLKQINPSLEQTISNNCEHFSSLENLLLHQVKLVKTNHLHIRNDQTTLETSWYNEKEGGLAILSELLKAYGFNFQQCLVISTFLSKQLANGGKCFESPNWSLLIDRGTIHLTPLSQPSQPIIAWAEEMNSVKTQLYTFSYYYSDNTSAWNTERNTAFLDADLVKFPLTIRKWQQGDSFYPLGMQSKKKLSDFMIDEKIPLNLKEKVVLILSQDEIIWVAGYRIDNRYKLTPSTKRMLAIKITEHV